MMKKRVLIVLVALMLLLCTAAPAAAEETESFIYDFAGLLTEKELASLQTKAEEVSEEYQCGVYIAAFSDMADYDFYDVEKFSEAVFTTLNLGRGEERNGILLVLSMGDRDYDLVAYGDFGNYAFTDYGKEVLADSFLDDFRYDDWAEGFSDYISTCDSMLQRAENSEPLDVQWGGGVQHSVSERLPSRLVIALIIGIVVALIYCSILKKKMKNAVAATEAAAYVANTGIVMTAAEDIFTHNTVIRQHIDHDSGNRGHGGGTSINSGGFSHSSGKF